VAKWTVRGHDTTHIKEGDAARVRASGAKGLGSARQLKRTQKIQNAVETELVDDFGELHLRQLRRADNERAPSVLDFRAFLGGEAESSGHIAGADANERRHFLLRQAADPALVNHGAQQGAGGLAETIVSEVAQDARLWGGGRIAVPRPSPIYKGFIRTLLFVLDPLALEACHRLESPSLTAVGIRRPRYLRYGGNSGDMCLGSALLLLHESDLDVVQSAVESSEHAQGTAQVV
jgi:hypothetical protein